MPQGSDTPWFYVLTRLIFKFVLAVFYREIIVEGEEFIPPRGSPCIICANHGNSLTDPLVLVASIPFKKRNFVRLTATPSLLDRPGLSSWIARQSRPVPLRRRVDSPDGQVDNTAVIGELMNALEFGDAVCIFPEGETRYHPSVAPLKTGVARIISGVLSRNRHVPSFEVSILTCSMTYLQPSSWRSDVLVTFHRPMKFTPATHPDLLAPYDYNDIRALTTRIHRQICSGTLHAGTWETLRDAQLAARLNGPRVPDARLNITRYVRDTQIAIEVLEVADTHVTVGCQSGPEDIDGLGRDLGNYRTNLSNLGLTDEDLHRRLHQHELVFKGILHSFRALILLTISLPGMTLWVPILLLTNLAVSRFTRNQPLSYTGCRISSRKIMYGLVFGLCTLVLSISLALLFVSPVFAVLVAPIMWTSLRLAEEGVKSSKVAIAAFRLALLDPSHSAKLLAEREGLCHRLSAMGIHRDDLDRTGLQAQEKGNGMGWSRSSRVWERLIIQTKHLVVRITGKLGLFDRREHSRLEDLDTTLPVLTNRFSAH